MFYFLICSFDMKNLFVNLVSLLFMGIMCVSCSNSKFNDAVSILGSLPVFFDDNRLDQTVSMEEGKIILSFTYNPQTPQWANDVLGDDWVAPVFLQKLFNNSIAVYAIGSILETGKGESPIDVFLDMAEEKQLKFLIKNSNQEKVLSVNEVRDILNDNSNKYMAAPFVAIQLDKFAKDYNSAIQAKGLYMANATMEEGFSGKKFICININCYGKLDLSKCNEIAEKALANYSALPIHCFHNELGIAFRYHSVDIEGLLVKNHVFEKVNTGNIDDKIFYVSSDYLSQLWSKIKKEMDRESNKEK